MNEPGQIEFTANAAFPVPRWARVTAFVGVYALVLAGMVELQQSVQDLLSWAGMDSGGVDGIGLLAGLYVAVMGLRPLLYLPLERNEGLYYMAWSLVTALSSLAAAIAALSAIRLAAPAFAESFAGSVAPVLAACLALGIGWTATKIATRRRGRMAGEGVYIEMEGDEQ